MARGEGVVKKSSLETGVNMRVRVNGKGKTIEISRGVSKVSEGEMVSRFVNRTQNFTLRMDERVLQGNLLEVEGKTYLKIGDRWLVLNQTDLQVLPLQKIVNSEFLLGNPGLRNFLGVDTITAKQWGTKLPADIRAVTELFGIAETRYSSVVIDEALVTLEATDLLALAERGNLREEHLTNYLDALAVVASKQALNYDEFKVAMDKLQIFLGVAPSISGMPLSEILRSNAKQVMVYLTKLKMGYPELLMDYVVKPEVQSQIKTEVDNMGTIVDGVTGEISEGDLVNVNFLDVTQKQELEAQFKSSGINPSDYKAIAEVGIAGQGSRILRDYFRCNKMDTQVFPTLEGFVEYLGAKGVAGRGLMARLGEKSYTGLIAMMAARNPGAIWIGGMPTIQSIEKVQGKGQRVLTQAVVHYLNTDGTFQQDKVDVGGHGFLPRTLANDAKALATMIEKGAVWEHIQGDDLGNEFNSGAMSWMIKTGQTPFSPLVTPQEIRFSDSRGDIARSLETGVEVIVDGKKAQKMEGAVIVMEDGTRLDLESERAKFRHAKKALNALIAQASSIKNDPPRQRDKIIEAMRFFQENIFESVRMIDVLINGEARGLFSCSQKSGGSLIEVAGGARFAEQSNYTKEVSITNSAGKTFTFPRNVFLAVMQRDFNTNHFSVDPIAIAANRDTEIKYLYHAFLEAAQDMQGDITGLAVKREVLEQVVARRIHEIGATDWAYRGLLVERLMLAVFPIPCEFKKDNEGKSFIKMNMMAQDVTSFESLLALSKVSAEKIQLEKLDEIMQAASEKITFADKAVVKNDVLGRLGIDLAPEPKLQSIARFKPIMVDVNDFTQAKDDFSQVNLRLEPVVGNFFDVTLSDLQRQALTGIWWAQEAVQLGLVGERFSVFFQKLAEEISVIGENLSVTASSQEKTMYAQKIDFLHHVREMVFAEDFAGLYQLSHQFEDMDKLGKSDTEMLVGLLQTPQTGSAA